MKLYFNYTRNKDFENEKKNICIKLIEIIIRIMKQIGLLLRG